MIILTIIAFIVIFSVLILVHEWGHFKMARRAGIKVEEFGIGLPPRAKALYTDKKGTVYSLNWIPFGGYVRMYGEDSGDPKILKNKDSFASKSLPQRAAVIVAGVVMNFILAWALITVGFSIGMKPFLVTQEDIAVQIEAGNIKTRPALYVHEIVTDSPAQTGGIEAGDAIIGLNGRAELPEAETLGESLKKGVANELTLWRGGKERTVTVVPNQAGQIGVSISAERMITEVGKVRYPFYQAPFKALGEVGRLSILTVKMMGNVVVNLVSKFTVPEGVAGPVGIARMTHTFVREGLMALLQFTALISISLGVINIMPFPALDGGRLLFIIFEIILRRRPSPKWEGAVHTIGFGLLMLMILAVTWHDIANLIK